MFSGWLALFILIFNQNTNYFMCSMQDVVMHYILCILYKLSILYNYIEQKYINIIVTVYYTENKDRCFSFSLGIILQWIFHMVLFLGSTSSNFHCLSCIKLFLKLSTWICTIHSWIKAQMWNLIYIDY